eukprot:1913997-Prymnesium_polylepis.1
MLASTTLAWPPDPTARPVASPAQRMALSSRRWSVPYATMEGPDLARGPRGWPRQRSTAVRCSVAVALGVLR